MNAPDLDLYFEAQRSTEKDLVVDELKILRSVAEALAEKQAPAPVPLRQRKRPSFALVAAALLVATAAIAGTAGYRAGKGAAHKEDIGGRGQTPAQASKSAADAAPEMTDATASADAGSPEATAAGSEPSRKREKRTTSNRAAGLEASLVQQARTALRRGLPAEAQRVLVRLRREFPNGQLAEERDVLVVEAYRMQGKLPLVRAAITEYRARSKKSPALRARIDEIEREIGKAD